MITYLCLDELYYILFYVSSFLFTIFNSFFLGRSSNSISLSLPRTQFSKDKAREERCSQPVRPRFTEAEMLHKIKDIFSLFKALKELPHFVAIYLAASCSLGNPLFVSREMRERESGSTLLTSSDPPPAVKCELKRRKRK